MNGFLVFCCGLFLICVSVAVVLMVGFVLLSDLRDRRKKKR